MSVLKQYTGELIGARKKVTIGTNVFIGMNTIIMKGVTIGDNVIIGAGSIVTRDIPSNSVACGNPARVICSIEKYYEKRVSETQKEAIAIFAEYYKRYHKIPSKKLFNEFFWLFEKRNEDLLPEFIEKMRLTGNYDDSIARFNETKPVFDGYDHFVEHCIKIMGQE